MAITLVTPGSTGKIYRGTPINTNAAYTVMFRVYVPSAINSTILWGTSGASGSSGGVVIGSYGDFVRGHSNGGLTLQVGRETGGAENNSGVVPNTGAWHPVCIRRTSATNVYLRLWGASGSGSGSNHTAVATDVTGREAQTMEGFFRNGQGINFVANARITNYKSWTVPLSDESVDSEILTVTALDAWSQSEMSDESVLANNLVEAGSSVNWTAGAGVAAGANDPAVNYGGGPTVKPAFYYSQM